MNIERISISGFANINSIELNLSNISALVALNNYGKSNVIDAIDFGVQFIKDFPEGKLGMMAYKAAIPINSKIDNNPYKFEVSFSLKQGKNVTSGIYGFAFDWIKNDKKVGQRIIDEYLKIKTDDSEKYKLFIKREKEKGFYLPSSKGRCDKNIKIKSTELIANKLKNYDDLFFLNIIEAINQISFIAIDTLQNPNKLFRTINPDVIRTDYSLDMPESSNVGFFIYSLKIKNPNLYAVFKDSVISLLPGIEDFEPFEIDMKDKFKTADSKSKIPLSFPDKLYDISVKEKNNNQSTNVNRLSSGSQKIFYVLANVIAAELNNVPLISFEELENSIHPGLLQRMLIILSELLNKTKCLITSHSPHLIQYLDINKIKIGVPNEYGLANFKEIKITKYKKLLRIAEDEGISIGDVIFDRIISCSKNETEIFEDICS